MNNKENHNMELVEKLIAQISYLEQGCPVGDFNYTISLLQDCKTALSCINTEAKPTAELETLALDYAGRCGFEHQKEGFRFVHVDDLTKAFMSFAKDAAILNAMKGDK